VQKAVRRFLVQTKIIDDHPPDVVAKIVLDFWAAIATLLHSEWENPRKHLISKGVGVYALMSIAADLYKERAAEQVCDKRYFLNKLADFILDVDWTCNGPLSGFGGESGVRSALAIIRRVRAKRRLRLSHG
jgi:hypothetical protein